MSEPFHPLVVPGRATDEVLREQLAAAVTDYNNAVGDPVAAVEAMNEIRRLRALLEDRR